MNDIYMYINMYIHITLNKYRRIFVIYLEFS